MLVRNANDAVMWKPTLLAELGHDEKYLEDLIACHPELLELDPYETGVSGRMVAFQQVKLPTPTGRVVKPDILFLSESGQVVVVEVKLGGNAELHDRRVVAQVIEYAAALSQCTEEELCRLMGGEGEAFEDLIARHFPNTSKKHALARALLRRLRDAEIHLIVAADRAPDGLHELVRGVTRQAALGAFTLRVIEIMPFKAEGVDGLLLLPKVRVETEIVARTAVTVSLPEDKGSRPSVSVVTTAADEIAETLKRTKRPLRPEFLKVLQAYDAEAPNDLQTFGTASNYRKVALDDWPGGLHYEFLDNSGGAGMIGVELHTEVDGFESLKASLKRSVSDLRRVFPQALWDPSWCKRRGRLHVRFAPESSASEIAAAMKTLIARTVDQVRPAVAREEAEG